MNNIFDAFKQLPPHVQMLAIVFAFIMLMFVAFNPTAGGAIISFIAGLISITTMRKN